MLEEIAGTVYLLLPLLGGAIAHAACMKFGWLGALARPIDAGRAFRGKPIFGHSKTWRGPVAVAAGTAAVLALQRHLLHPIPAFASLELVDYAALPGGWFGLLAGAALFFLIAAVRLMRRTQGFWTWLLGFALYGGRWAYAQQDGLLPTIQGIDPNAYLQPQALLQDLGAPTAQVGLLGIILIVGLFTFIVDAADRSYWDKQGA